MSKQKRKYKNKNHRVIYKNKNKANLLGRLKRKIVHIHFDKK